MSWALLREAQRDSTLGARQMGRKMVLMFLARRAEDSGVVKVGGRVVAEETGLDHRRVRRLLHELEEMGRIDLVSEGAAGRGRAHTWRVLNAAEWEARRLSMEPAERAEKWAPMPPIRAEEKGGMTNTEKGASPPTLEQNNNRPLTPPMMTAPTLPGLGAGEEDLPALGATGSRVRGRNPRALGRSPRARGENPRSVGSSPRALTHAEKEDRRVLDPPASAVFDAEESERERDRPARLAAARATLERIRAMPRVEGGAR